MKILTAVLVPLLLGAAFALDCSGPADIVIAVPGSFESVPEEEFQHLEKFLTGVLSYYDISPDNAHVGLVLYGREPVVISDLENALSRPAINARITLLSQRTTITSQISGGQNVPKAIHKVSELLTNGREDVPKIGIIMTYGSTDLTSSDPEVVAAQVADVAKSAIDEGIVLFATSTGGTVPAFPNITRDFCNLFSLGDYANLDALLPYLASAVCYVIDDNVTVTYPDCFPVVQPPPTTESFQCGSLTTTVADPSNCAYRYECPLGSRVRCGTDLLFDPSIQQCNHKEFVTCYSGIACPSQQGLFPHPTDCSMFLSCSQNIPYVQNCPQGLLFNKAEEFCDFPENVKCDSETENPEDLFNRIPA